MLNRPLGCIQISIMGQFFGCCFVVSPNPLTNCYTVARYRPLHGRSSVVPCCLIFLISYLTVLRGVFVIRDIAAGDRWLLFQKCKIAERLVFNKFDFRCCDIFSNGKDVSDKSLYTQLYIYTYSYISECSRKIFREISRDIPSKS